MLRNVKKVLFYIHLLSGSSKAEYLKAKTQTELYNNNTTLKYSSIRQRSTLNEGVESLFSL